jgi:outer membrane receptor protein involved in Fe transport
VGPQSEIKITLTEDVKELIEVVVVGYGVQKRTDLTGAVASITGDKLSEIPIAGIDQALQGRAAGVNIIPKTGRPGSGVDIQIRGTFSHFICRKL